MLSVVSFCGQVKMQLRFLSFLFCLLFTFVVSGAASIPRSFSSWWRIKSACLLSLRTEAVAIVAIVATNVITMPTTILTTTTITIKRVSQEELDKKKHTKTVKNCNFYKRSGKRLRSTEFLPSSSRVVGDWLGQPLLCSSPASNFPPEVLSSGHHPPLAL